MNTFDVISDFLEESGHPDWAAMVRAGLGEEGAIILSCPASYHFGLEMLDDPSSAEYPPFRFADGTPVIFGTERKRAMVRCECRWNDGSSLNGIIMGYVVGDDNETSMKITLLGRNFLIPYKSVGPSLSPR